MSTGRLGGGRAPLITRVMLLMLALLLSGAVPPTAATDDDVTAAEDNPPGCTTATDENNDGCGAQGRDHFAQANHRPPVEACAESVAPSGSTVTRILPDGPRRGDGSLAFISGACVYLPPGYATSALRYPVIHVLHGGGGDQADWVTFGDIRGILDRAYAQDPSRAVIAVMPDGRSGQWYDYQNGSFLIETYVLDHLVPYVDEHFRTIADRGGRAIVGLSNGGYGAIHLAGKRPDRFVAAGGMSSNLGARTMRGLGPDGAVHYQGSVPYQLAENYDEVDLILDVGTYCTAPDPFCATIIVDLLFLPDHLAFDRRMDDVGHRGDVDMRLADGAHQFTWWKRWLEERQLPYLHERLADPRPAAGASPTSRIPPEFRYRSIKSRFSVWGYDVSVERSAREFLDLKEVTAGGFTLRGSGQAVVTTAAYYEPGATYTVTGTTADDTALLLTADSAGRLRIPVDLGASHQHDQFTDSADLAEATDSGYWTERTVSISHTESGRPVFAPPPPVPAAARQTLNGAGARHAEPGVEAGGARDGSGAVGPEPSGGVLGTVRRAVAPIVADAQPQLVPTILFLALLTAGPVWWWRRRAAGEAGR